MEIKLKESANIEAINAEIQGRVKNHFITDQETLDWLFDINTNSDSRQRHLKPKEGNLTLEDIREIFPRWTETGLFEADLYFGRTTAEEMQIIADFIVTHQQDISYITDVKMLIERGEIAPSLHPILKLLERPQETDEEYPAEEQAKQRELQGGHLLCKSWGMNPFWVIYGAVDSPRFLKERKYIENIMNPLYRDDQGRAYLLIPLHDFSQGFSEKAYKEAWEMGLREHPSYFIPYCYSGNLQSIKETAKSFFEFYSSDELVERFQHVIARILRNAELLYTKVTWKTTGIAVDTRIPNEHLVLVANALFLALKMHYGSLKRAFIGQTVTMDTLLSFKKGKLALKKSA